MATYSTHRWFVKSRAAARSPDAGNTEAVEGARVRVFAAHRALFIGFGGLLALLAYSGIDAVQVLSKIQAGNEEIRQDFVKRARKLEQIRSDVYISGTYVRDYLLEPDAATAEQDAQRLSQTRRMVNDELTSYESVLSPEETDTFRTLRQELDSYWHSLDPVFSWDSAQRRASGYLFLRDQVFPRRTSVLGVADRIASINEQQLHLGDLRLSQLFLGFRRRLMITLAATLTLGVLLAAASIWHMLRLERQTSTHLNSALRAGRELKILSARLVDAQENERKAISRELHDAVGQSLSAVLMELRNLAAVLTSEPGRTHLETIRKLVEGTVGLVRNMALLLRPSMLDDLGLIPALQWQARDVSKRTGLQINVAADCVPEDLPEEYTTCVYRVVQEALHNCSKHAEARTVRITIQESGGRLVLSVQDDGIGFDRNQEWGLGLLGIQERVVNLDGSFEIVTQPSHGTLLAVSLPLRRASAKEAVAV